MDNVQPCAATAARVAERWEEARDDEQQHETRPRSNHAVRLSREEKPKFYPELTPRARSEMNEADVENLDVHHKEFLRGEWMIFGGDSKCCGSRTFNVLAP